MAILKANILAEVNKRTARQETDIDSILKAVLLDITLQVPVLKVEATTETVEGQGKYSLGSFPETIRTISVVKIDNGEPLILIRSIKDYHSLIAEETSGNWGEPESYLVYNNCLYLYPTPDKVYTLTVIGANLEIDADNIDLPDYYEEAVIEGACFKLYESKGLGNTPPAQTHAMLYQDLINKLGIIEAKKESVGNVVYRDI